MMVASSGKEIAETCVFSSDVFCVLLTWTVRQPADLRRNAMSAADVNHLIARGDLEDRHRVSVVAAYAYDVSVVPAELHRTDAAVKRPRPNRANQVLRRIAGDVRAPNVNDGSLAHTASGCERAVRRQRDTGDVIGMAVEEYLGVSGEIVHHA
mmetsp:Transcript_27307/g.29806  ORF Transcript_27307/g.29806 Transcript_27307/m.29806 type:complete len:153 (+) Transcript_27307:460-918(+)